MKTCIKKKRNTQRKKKIMKGGEDDIVYFNALPETYEDINSIFELLKALYSGKLTDFQMLVIHRRYSNFYNTLVENKLTIHQQVKLFQVFLIFKQYINNIYNQSFKNITNNNVDLQYGNFSRLLDKLYYEYELLYTSKEELIKKKERNAKTMKNRLLGLFRRKKHTYNNINIKEANQHISEKKNQIVFENIIKNYVSVLIDIFNILNNRLHNNNDKPNNKNDEHTNTNTSGYEKYYSFKGLLEELRKIFITDKDKLLKEYDIYKLIIIYFKLRILNLKIRHMMSNYNQLPLKYNSNEDFETIKTYKKKYNKYLSDIYKKSLNNRIKLLETEKELKQYGPQEKHIPTVSRQPVAGKHLTQLSTIIENNNNNDLHKEKHPEGLSSKSSNIEVSTTNLPFIPERRKSLILHTTKQVLAAQNKFLNNKRKKAAKTIVQSHTSPPRTPNGSVDFVKLTELMGH